MVSRTEPQCVDDVFSDGSSCWRTCYRSCGGCGYDSDSDACSSWSDDERRRRRWRWVSGDGESVSVGIWSDDVSDCGTCISVCACVCVHNDSLQVNLLEHNILLNLKANVAVLQGKFCRLFLELESCHVVIVACVRAVIICSVHSTRSRACVK